MKLQTVVGHLGYQKADRLTCQIFLHLTQNLSAPAQEKTTITSLHQSWAGWGGGVAGWDVGSYNVPNGLKVCMNHNHADAADAAAGADDDDDNAADDYYYYHYYSLLHL